MLSASAAAAIGSEPHLTKGGASSNLREEKIFVEISTVVELSS